MRLEISLQATCSRLVRNNDTFSIVDYEKKELCDKTDLPTRYFASKNLREASFLD